MTYHLFSSETSVWSKLKIKTTNDQSKIWVEDSLIEGMGILTMDPSHHIPVLEISKLAPRK